MYKGLLSIAKRFHHIEKAPNAIIAHRGEMIPLSVRGDVIEIGINGQLRIGLGFVGG